VRVSLFVTCLVDQISPGIGVATVELLERLGVEVSFNSEQGCCGQPAFNTGYFDDARTVATATLALCERELMEADYIVVPSGSCATMFKKHYEHLFAESEKRERAQVVGTRVFELTEFLTEVLEAEDVAASYKGRVVYHESCHLRRDLNISNGPRSLIEAVNGVELVELEKADACCGFGGTFSMKFPELSAAIADEKAQAVEKSGAETLVACDVSCLMHTERALARRGSSVRCMHIAELLAGK
jgi:L-lactate dehydrogenase complex protein LldE